MNKIENSNQLKNEIQHLQRELERKGIILKASINVIREDLKPENIAFRAISSATGINFVKGNFLKSGIMATITILVHRFISKKESLLEKKIFSWAEFFINLIKGFKSKSED